MYVRITKTVTIGMWCSLMISLIVRETEMNSKRGQMFYARVNVSQDLDGASSN